MILLIVILYDATVEDLDCDSIIIDDTRFYIDKHIPRRINVENFQWIWAVERLGETISCWSVCLYPKF